MNEEDGLEQQYGPEVKRYDSSQVRPAISKYIDDMSQNGNFENFIDPFVSVFFDWRDRAFTVLEEGARQLIKNKLPEESWSAYFDENVPAKVLTRDLYREFSPPIQSRFSQFSDMTSAEFKAIHAFLIDFFDLVIHQSEIDSFDYHHMFESAGFPLQCHCHDTPWGYKQTFEDWYEIGSTPGQNG
jgi:hypothetical protein